ncbi:MAG: DUF5671 domain-containing protein [Candidatus Pacebacteria bacterium]|jgi:hypothetical protein|nr:DUF5671 domain-containing protein [Candidatus Paceibacterota bacterium]
MTTSHTPHSSVRDFFLHLGSAIALYASTISLLNLLFAVINARFPDILAYGVDSSAELLRVAIATLVILFPLYLIFMYVLNTDLAKHAEKRDSSVRKWLTYITLFLTGSAIVVDLVVLINRFLGGEVTERFIWKVLAVLVVASSVFVYYFLDIKNYWQTHRIRSRSVAIGAVVFVLVSILVAFGVVGSPKMQRLQRIDSQKVSDLQSIQWQIINYWQQKGKLPQELSLLVDPLSGFVLPKDPETHLGKMYTYAVIDKQTFQICADFNLQTPKIASMNSPEGGPMGATVPDTLYYPSGNENWEHDAGVFCYKRIIDPDLYPVLKK